MQNFTVELSFLLIEKICVVIVVAYLITRTKYFNSIIDKNPTSWDRLILMLAFGGFSIYGTYSGIKIFGAIANIRDLGPMIAGLVGGPFIGVGAGLIGGIHRYSLGGFTAISCSLATIISGLLGGLIYELKRREFIGVFWAALFAIFMESLHMFLALLIAKPFAEALRLVKEVSLPMIIANGIGVAIFALIIVNLIKERKTSSERDRYYAELERKIYEMEKLYRLGVQVSSTLDINVVLDLCVNTTVEVHEAKMGLLFLVDEKSNRLFLGSMAISKNETLHSPSLSSPSSVKTIKRGKLRLKEGEGIANQVAKNKKPLLVNKVETKELLSNPIYKDVGFKVKSILCVPLLAKDEVIGVIQVCNKRGDAAFNNEDQHLLVSFAVHAAIAIENAKLYQEVAEKERMKRELEIAHKLQTSLLPDKSPQIKGYQIAAMSIPAREVGGDFYDFIDVVEGKIGLVIGDVAGKGLPAALFMALSRSFLRAQAIGNLKANIVLEKANKLIANDAKEGIFVTALYAILDAPAKVLQISNAGHNPSILFHSNTGECEELRMGGIVLGAFDEARFQEKEITLKKGDIVVFYTDGIVEAIDNNNQQFGMERLIKIIKDKPYLEATELIKLIKKKMKEFTKDQPQFDDFTLMVVKVT
ncbi:SpoIIE family protein phosphatase [Patescibacteria group bacterium]|nr:SpoIIE family protein phosphatase [Patescibacteria group bacterium]